jgi:hypothetical protein
MAGIAIRRSGDMGIIFAYRGRAIVTRRASAGYAVMAEFCVIPGTDRMATIAFQCRDDVVARLAGLTNSVMAVGTRPLGIGVVINRRQPTPIIMAVLTFIIADNMIGVLAGGRASVMASYALAYHRIMAHAACRPPCAIIVAFFAVIA